MYGGGARDLLRLRPEFSRASGDAVVRGRVCERARDDPAVDRIRPMAEKEESRIKRDPAELRGKRSSSSYPILAASSLKLSSEDVELQSSE